MADGQTKKTSLFSETWNALKASKNIWWHWAAGVGLFMAIANWVYGQRTPLSAPMMKMLHDNPSFFKEHPELIPHFMQNTIVDLSVLLVYMLFAFLIHSITFYFVTVGYLRFSGIRPQLTYSRESFFHWLGQVVWKYSRPSLWLLLPFIGVFFYIRSTIYYAVVSPLAILGRGNELPTSWKMTQNNWWRIFLNQVGINIVMGLCVWLVALVPMIAVLIIVYGKTHAPLYVGFVSIVQGLALGIGMAATAIYTCTVYRVLTEEGSTGA
jgi:hypothetical protein